MKITIKKGRHRPLIPPFGIFYEKKIMERLVTFHANCAYKLEGIDQLDINKAFGIGYFPHHHRESARFGWRYNGEMGTITLFAYCYVAGKRETRQIGDIPLEREVRLKIYVGPSHYFFDVTYSVFQHFCMIRKDHDSKWAYPLGVYFGGDKKAPKDMQITIKKL